MKAKCIRPKIHNIVISYQESARRESPDELMKKWKMKKNK